MYVIDCQIKAAELLSEAKRLDQLKHDFEMAAYGSVPKDDALQNFPFMDNWGFAYFAAPCLSGYVTGHPVLEGKDRHITTSQVWMMSKDGQWARTQSRWYRLGRRAEPVQ